MNRRTVTASLTARLLAGLLCAGLSWTALSSAIQAQPAPDTPAAPPKTAPLTGHLSAPARQDAPSNYILGPDDQLTIQAPDAEEIAKAPVRVDMRGNINLPLVGRIQATGLTADELEEQIKLRLRKYLQEPDVTVAITEFRSQP